MQLPLPTHLQPNGRVCFYGYDILEEWFINLGKTYNPTNDEPMGLLFSAMQVLKAQTDIKTLRYDSACVDPTAPTDTILCPQGGEPMVPILSICHGTTNPKSYNRRPKQS
jgi:hypothetical protein